jgi:hypothetical protein
MTCLVVVETERSSENGSDIASSAPSPMATASTRQGEGERAEGIGRPKRASRGATTRPERWGHELRMVDTPRMRVVHCGTLPSTWWVIVWSTWDTFLGQVQAELDVGPKSKVVAHVTLYNFSLRTMVIWVLD